MTQAKDIIDDVLATAMHATRTVVTTSLGSTSRILVFRRDLILNAQVVADWRVTTLTHEQKVNENLHHWNLKHRPYDYEQS